MTEAMVVPIGVRVAVPWSREVSALRARPGMRHPV